MNIYIYIYYNALYLTFAAENPQRFWQRMPTREKPTDLSTRNVN